MRQGLAGCKPIRRVFGKHPLEEIKSIMDGTTPGQFTTLTARSIRLGSYKSFSKEKIVFVEKAIQITVPSIFEREFFYFSLSSF